MVQVTRIDDVEMSSMSSINVSRHYSSAVHIIIIVVHGGWHQRKSQLFKNNWTELSADSGIRVSIKYMFPVNG